MTAPSPSRTSLRWTSCSPTRSSSTSGAGISWPATTKVGRPCTTSSPSLGRVTGGTFHLDVHGILADDEHAAVLLTSSASREGKHIETNDVHVYHLRDGTVTEFWDSSTDQYASDELLG